MLRDLPHSGQAQTLSTSWGRLLDTGGPGRDRPFLIQSPSTGGGGRGSAGASTLMSGRGRTLDFPVTGSCFGIACSEESALRQSPTPRSTTNSSGSNRQLRRSSRDGFGSGSTRHSFMSLLHRREEANSDFGMPSQRFVNVRPQLPHQPINGYF